MKLVVGLGNPGKRFSDTRHNLGFKAVNELARRHRIEKEEHRFEAIVGHCRINAEKTLLVKPLTYMNLSGKAVQPIMRFYKIPLEDLIVIYDDMDLPFAALRIRAGGGSGGHKGVLSIIEMLGSQDFARIRIGIGRPPQGAVEWVLSAPLPEERQELEAAVHSAADAVECWIKEGLIKAMNRFN
ncbi:MAG: aminoacyl-tRNA hydrolase [Syntrophomonadaceae bacterium]|jgi:PTH1 family peptidyl-tRNA hydrolase|nr:aminoacyl-tRNA hydrolase [Syntrophomonadaceae bacterium]